MRVGYMRLSKAEFELLNEVRKKKIDESLLMSFEKQKNALLDEGIPLSNIYHEVAENYGGEHNVYDELLCTLSEGDELIVYSYDRLFLTSPIAALKGKGITVKAVVSPVAIINSIVNSLNYTVDDGLIESCAFYEAQYRILNELNHHKRMEVPNGFVNLYRSLMTGKNEMSKVKFIELSGQKEEVVDKWLSILIRQDIEDDIKKSMSSVSDNVEWFSSGEEIYLKYMYNPFVFESFCTNLLNMLGYEAEKTQDINDSGVDIRARKRNREYHVQCKCFNSLHKIGRADIQRLVGTDITHKKRFIFITTSSFTAPAIEYAKDCKMELWDGEKLVDKINEAMKTL